MTTSPLNPEALGDLYEALEDARDLIHAGYCEPESAADEPEREDDGASVTPIHCEECRCATAALEKARSQ